MRRWMSAFCAGVIILHCTAVLLPWWLFILVSVGLFLCCPARHVLMFQFLLLGWFYANQAAYEHQSSIIPAEFEASWLRIEGRVCSQIITRSRHIQFEFCADRIIKNPGKILSGHRKLMLSAPHDMAISAGEGAITLSAKLKRPSGTVNPVGGSYEQTLFYRRISGTGWVRHRWSPAPDHKVHAWRAWGLQWRATLLERFQNLSEGLAHAGILRALVMGDRSAIPLSQRRALSESGTLHLMAISGLHVGMILLLFWRFLPQTGAGITLLALAGLAYVAFVGFPASAIRAWLMCCVALLMRIGFIRPHGFTALVVSAAAMLVVDPLSPMSMGFCLSFLTVGFLVFVARSGWLGPGRGLLSLLGLQMGFVFFLIPVNAVFGLPHNLVSIPANMVAIPWVSWVILPGGLLATLVSLLDIESARWLLDFLDGCLGVLLGFLDALQILPGEINLDHSTIRLLTFCLLLCVVIGLGRPMYFSVLLIICLFLSAVSATLSQTRRDQIVVLDVGQGLSILIQHDHHHWVYDLGASYERGSAFERVLLPMKRAYFPAEALDGLIISHGDSDHAGDLNFALERLDPVLRLTGEVARLNNAGFEPCRQGGAYQSRELAIQTLYPRDGGLDASANNRSCVIMVTLKGQRFLLMGDLEGEAEKQLVREFGNALRAEVLIAGHHGSRNATSMALLKAVRPGIVVFSAGYRNRFGHPHGLSLERTRRFGAEVYSTAEDGALVFDLSDGRLQVRRMRDQRRAFWMRDG